MLEVFLENDKAKETLVRMVRDGRLSHALLLEGPEGVGKTTFARLVAAAALCEGSTRPCGSCRHCIKVQRDIHPDLITLSGEGGSRSFHIDRVRELTRQAQLVAGEGRIKVFLLTHTQNMTVQAQNALLKLIEEPPAATMFILTCQNRHALLPTILSRVAVIGIEPLSPRACADALTRLHPGLPPRHYQEAAAACAGSLGQALTLLDQPESRTDLLANTLLEQAVAGKAYAMLAALHPFERARDRHGFAMLLEALGELARRQVARPGITSPLQAVQIVAIIEEAKLQTRQNVGLGLVSALLCAGLTSTLARPGR